jgi:Tfp pilus assembly protein PilN
MARKHLNFIPEDLRPGLEIPHEWIPATLLVLFCVYAAQWPIRITIQTRLREDELSRLEKTGADLSEKLVTLSNQTKVEIKTNENLKEIQTVLSRKNYWSEIFKEMSVLIPENVWLTRFSNKKAELKPEPRTTKKPDPKVDSKVEKDPVAALLAGGASQSVNKQGQGITQGEVEQLIVQGEAISQMAVARFLTVLEQSHYFSGARLVSTEQVKNVKPAKFKFEFTIPIHANAEGKNL